ncbi:MAG: MerR family transcriptional regulator [Streptosporangiales bacterium]|nr:MerR family transcriptional regulator [Streptosporangiales bacterium]
MEDTSALLNIGAFASKVGLSPSALRFYDDCGVLRPAHVDEDTGYRYYAPEQEARALRVRRLREAGLPLTEAALVLDGSPAEARAVLEEHARRTRATAAAAQAAVEEILRELPGGTSRAAVTVGGAELAGAVRQVAPSAATGAAAEEHPALGCVLIELDGAEVRLTATDRYRLAIRDLRPGAVEGGPRRLLVPAAELTAAASWGTTRPEVTIEVDSDGVRLRAGDEVRPLSRVTAAFPDYRMILDDLPAARHRVITGRDGLRAVLAASTDRVTLRADEGRLDIAPASGDLVELPAIRIGPPVTVIFDPAVLLPAIDAGAGPDALLEIASPRGPVVVRSADQGSFTTLVMPIHDPAATA